MKKTLTVLIFSAFMTALFGQEEAQTAEKSAPVRFTFGTATLIDNQTIASPYKGGIELQIQHRFSLIENISNLYGIYGAANTRLGLNYGITDRLMIGAGTTKDYKLQDLQWKYLILQQTEDNSMPVSLSYYGNIVADLREDEHSDLKPVIRKFTDCHISPSLLLHVNLVRKFLFRLLHHLFTLILYPVPPIPQVTRI